MPWPVKPYKAGKDDIDVGINPEREVECRSSNGSTITINEWKTPSDRSATMAVAQSFACGFGLEEFEIVQAGRWAAAATDSEDNQDHDLHLRMAKALNVDLTVKKCDNKDSSDADEETTTTLDADDLVPADEAARSRAGVGELGKPIKIEEGVNMILSNPRVGGDDEPWIEIEVRIENPTGEDAPGLVPDVVCAGATEGESYQADSTVDPQEDVLAGSFAEGTVNLLPAGNERIGGPISECESPAVIRVGEVDVPVPADVFAQYNAAAAAAGARHMVEVVVRNVHTENIR